MQLTTADWQQFPAIKPADEGTYLTVFDTEEVGEPDATTHFVEMNYWQGERHGWQNTDAPVTHWALLPDIPAEYLPRDRK